MTPARPRAVHRRSAWRLAALVFGLVAAALPVIPATPAGAASPALSYVRKADLGIGEQLVVDNVHQRAIGLDPGDNRLSVYDGTGHRLRQQPLAPYALPTGSFGSVLVDALDEQSGHLYVYATQASQPYILVYDGDLQLLAAKPLAAFPPVLVPTGLSYSASTHRLEIAAEPLGLLVGDYGVEIAELDATTLDVVMPATALPTCQRLVSFARQAAVVRRGSVIWVPCGTGNLVLVPQPGVPSLLAVDTSTSPVSVSAYPIAGNFAQGESLADVAAGRMIMFAAGPNVPAQAAWVFDEDHRVILGVIAAGNINLLGGTVNPLNGTLVVVIDSIVLLSSDRGLQIPQATTFPYPDAWVNNWNATLVPFADTFFVQYYDQHDQAERWAIFRVNQPAYVPPQPLDPDTQTSDLQEQPGMTEAQFSGDGQAVGERIYEVGGVNGVLQNVMPSAANYWDLAHAPGGLSDGDRDLYLSRISRAHVGVNDASARSIAVDRDELTDGDYANLTKEGWPYAPAVCNDLGADARAATTDGAAASCDQQGHTVHATSGYTAAAPLPQLTVGASSSSLDIRTTPASGVVVSAHAEARRVEIAGVIHIGKVVSDATASAHGRPGTSVASYKRAFENVTAPGYSCTTQCDPQAVISALNSALQSVKVTAELPDAAVVATPRGAQGTAVRDPWQHQQDVVYNDESQVELQVPALRFVYVNDNVARSRMVVDLAATDASATYLIFRTGDAGGASGDDSAAAPLDGAPLLTGVLPDLPRPVATVAPGTAPGVTPAVASPHPRTLLQSVGDGLRILFTGRHDLLLNALMWTLLATPLVLAARRRHLLRLAGESR